MDTRILSTSMFCVAVLCGCAPAHPEIAQSSQGTNERYQNPPRGQITDQMDREENRVLEGTPAYTGGPPAAPLQPPPNPH